MTGTLQALDQGLGAAAPLPRANGELVFEEPWQARALGMGVAVMDRLGVDWAAWRPYLVAAIAAHQPADAETAATAYYSAWLDALDALVASRTQA